MSTCPTTTKPYVKIINLNNHDHNTLFDCTDDIAQTERPTTDDATTDQAGRRRTNQIIGYTLYITAPAATPEAAAARCITGNAGGGLWCLA